VVPAHLGSPGKRAVKWVCVLYVYEFVANLSLSLPLTVSCFSKIQIGFTFLVPAHLGSPGKIAVKWVCVSCVYEFVANLLLSLPAKEFVQLLDASA